MVGKSLSHYQIEAELGRGGMGIVYQAQDTKLARTVAIKVLPAGALASEDDRARFDREAKAAAALNHPNIAIVYEVDQATPSDAPPGTAPSSFIAMEFIEGESLEAKVKSGPMNIDEALRIALEIASGLEAAHEKNIVHRDIKSANVMLTKKGVAKILDFGLAQTAQSTKLTMMGSTLGTVAYMSPEQARGEPVDLRTDIWALGTVLYEMISGRNAFPGDYEQAVVYSILNEDPEPLTSIRTNVPVSMDWIVSKCLAKNAGARYQSTTELIVDLKAVDTSKNSTYGLSRVTTGPRLATESKAQSSVSGLASTVKKAWPLMLALGLVCLVIGYLISPMPGEVSGDKPLLKLQLHIPGVTELASPTVSPNSEYIAFTGRDSDGTRQLFLLNNATKEITSIPKGNGARRPHFSPDGTRLVFGEGLSTITVYSLQTRVPTPYYDIGNNPVWENDSSFLYTGDGGQLRRYDLETDSISVLLVPDSTKKEDWRFFAYSMIPGTRKAIGGMGGGPGSEETAIIIDLETRQWEKIDDGLADARYIPGDFLSYRLGGENGSVHTRRFELGSTSTSNSQKQVIPPIATDAYHIGADGSFIYVPSSIGQETLTIQLSLYDIEQKNITVLQSAAPKNEVMFRPSFSPDGLKIALDNVTKKEGEFYVSLVDLKTGQPQKRTFGAGRAGAIWSHDSKFLYYHGFDFRDGRDLGIYKQSINSPGEEELLLASPAIDPAFSRTGEFLAFSRDEDLFIYNMSDGSEVAIDTTIGMQRYPSFSPDGAFLSYTSDESGPHEFIVRSLTGSIRERIQFHQASQSKWSRDGKYLYFLAKYDGIYRLPVSTDPFLLDRSKIEKVVNIDGLGNGMFFDISPNSKTLAITANPLKENPKDDYSVLEWWQNWAVTLDKDK